ncbi:MAG: cytoplasmic protein [Candidatus Geothermarchaeales archaeon]
MSKDPAKVAPHAYRVVFEDDRVRVLDHVLEPGEKTDMHHHPALVAVPITDGRYRFTLPDGEKAEAETKAGGASFAEAVDHATENIFPGRTRIILVELK